MGGLISFGDQPTRNGLAIAFTSVSLCKILIEIGEIEVNWINNKAGK
ncbi:MAG: hypothetical protein MUO40_10980 [Anaerolineaceae bacterium]|nr:hypothetical protein [Anaerolineaceae bacterium]